MMLVHSRGVLQYFVPTSGSVLLAPMQHLRSLRSSMRYIYVLKFDQFSDTDPYTPSQSVPISSAQLKRKNKYLQHYNLAVQSGKTSDSYDAWLLQRPGGNRVPGGWVQCEERLPNLVLIYRLFSMCIHIDSATQQRDRSRTISEYSKSRLPPIRVSRSSRAWERRWASGVLLPSG